MPIYEFYCPDCHMIFNFFSLRVNTDKIPSCPKCGRDRLKRKFSVFSIKKGGGIEGNEEDGLPDLNIDEEKLENVIEEIGKEMDGLDENNSVQVAKAMRRFFEETGIKLGAGMEEAIRRMEAGEDPEKLEKELGDILENEEDLFQIKSLKGTIKRIKPPKVDETLYDL